MVKNTYIYKKNSLNNYYEYCDKKKIMINSCIN